MNDFTKEELRIIACNLCINPKTKDILRKLAAMIDNYCDHKHGVYFVESEAFPRCKNCRGKI